MDNLQVSLASKKLSFHCLVAALQDEQQKSAISCISPNMVMDGKGGQGLDRTNKLGYGFEILLFNSGLSHVSVYFFTREVF